MGIPTKKQIDDILNDMIDVTKALPRVERVKYDKELVSLSKRLENENDAESLEMIYEEVNELYYIIFTILFNGTDDFAHAYTKVTLRLNIALHHTTIDLNQYIYNWFKRFDNNAFFKKAFNRKLSESNDANVRKNVFCYIQNINTLKLQYVKNNCILKSR